MDIFVVCGTNVSKGSVAVGYDGSGGGGGGHDGGAL